MEFFDSHAHLDDEKFDQDRRDLINNIYQEHITKIITVGYHIESSKKAVQLSDQYNWIYAAVGISPNDIEEAEEKIAVQIGEIEKLIQSAQLQNHKPAAIGEIGLDYYWNKENKELQKYAFIKQIELSNSYELPVIIHNRDAMQDTLDILKNIAAPIKKGVFHCCQLNRELVKQVLELGFYISLAGPVTFKNAKNADEIIEMIPMDKLLIETDSPYLSPEPNRGKRNDPRNVKFVAEKIADIKKVTILEIATSTYQNAMNLFEINK